MPRSSRTTWTILAGPYFLLLLVLLVLPLLNVGLLSFYTYSTTQIAQPTLTMRNYENLLDPHYVRLFARTMKIGLLTTIFCAILAFPVAYFLARARQTVLTVGLFLLVAPLMVSTVIRVFGWSIILGRKGLLNNLVGLVGVSGGTQILYTETAVIIGLISVCLPFMVLPIMSSIERVPRSLEEAARNLGASWYEMFAQVIWPLSVPGLASGSLLVYSASISALVIPALMGGSHVRMVGAEIYDALLVSFNWPNASSLSFVLLVLAMVMVFFALRFAGGAGRRGRAR